MIGELKGEFTVGRLEMREGWGLGAPQTPSTAKEYHKVTTGNKTHTRDLFGGKTEWL